MTLNDTPKAGLVQRIKGVLALSIIFWRGCSANCINHKKRYIMAHFIECYDNNKYQRDIAYSPYSESIVFC